MSKITGYVNPAKFLSTSFWLILLLSLTDSYDNNIKAGIDDESEDGSLSESEATTGIMIGMALSIIFVLIEIVIIFLGATLFFDKSNMIQFMNHILGSIVLIIFMLDEWRYQNFWPIWLFFSVAPFLFEVTNAILSKTIYRRRFLS